MTSLNHAVQWRHDDPEVERAFVEADNATDPHCEFCNRPVDLSHDYRRVTGWLKAGSWDGFKRDGYEDSWAHKACIEIEKTVGHGQEALDV